MIVNHALVYELVVVGILTFDQGREESDVGCFATTGRQGQTNSVQFVTKEFAAVLGLCSEKGRRRKKELVSIIPALQR